MRLSRPSPLMWLFVTATVVTLALAWFGWESIARQQALEQRRLHERLEDRADALAAGIHGLLAETGDRLNAWLVDGSLPSVERAVIVGIAGGVIDVSPPGALPFRPGTLSRIPIEPHVGAADPRIRAAEVIEARTANAAAAVSAYRTLSTHDDPAVRGPALLRLGAALRRSGDTSGALDAYRRLAALGHVAVDGYPAELAAMDGRRVTLTAAGRLDEAEHVATEIVTAIDEGRWSIARGTAESYRDSLTRTARPESWQLAGAVADQWQQWMGLPPERGLRAAPTAAGPVILLWRARGSDVALLAAFADRFLPPAASDSEFELTDSGGVRIAGIGAPMQAVTRVTGDASSAWTLRIWEPAAPLGASHLAASAPTITVGLATVVFLWVAVYFTARAMRREARVARLQSDFVAAVSHEFRSPLTTMRQLSELLEMGETPSPARRQTYYELLARESRRLQRLVETLLNFGRMEAGAERYRREPVEVADLVRQIAQDVESQQAGSGGPQIDVSGPDEGACVTGDADALGLVVRNLLDNAIKYSPGAETVRVEWGAAGGLVSLRVIDHGIGIERSEQDAIFDRFVRGRAAAAANVRGTGVGLAMVRHVVSAHGGQVSVDSEVGRGSTFTVVLPRAT